MAPESGSNSTTAQQSPHEDTLEGTLSRLGPSFDLTEYVSFDPTIRAKPVARGGFGLVYKSVYKPPNRDDTTVAIKRLFFEYHCDIAKVAAREIYIWSGLVHPNVIQFLGFILDEDKRPLFISEWMENGSVLKYVESHTGCDVIHLILGIAEGLDFLHGREVVHADIKSDNILVNSSGNAVICDFGISRAMNATQIALGGNTTHPNGPGGSTRWMAYEMIADYETYNKFTKYSDVWAFGMTIYELLIREKPYAYIHIEAQITVALMQKKLPIPPTYIDIWPEKYQGVWKLCTECWNFDPLQRISMTEVVGELNKLSMLAPQQTLDDLLKVTLDRLSFLDLSGCVTFDRLKPMKDGGFYVVYTGICDSLERGKVIVTIKCLRNLNSVSAKIMAKEIYIWFKVAHPNVLQLLGFIINEENLLSLVSERMENGSVLEYVKSHPECGVIHLILGIAKGLEYLHERDIVHSDKKSDNILVNSCGDAVICDVGITRGMNATQVGLGGNTTGKGAAGTIRWMAYELLAESEKYTRHTKETDVWAFGMTVYELLAKERPYAHISIETQVIISVMRRQLPKPPAPLDTWPKKKKEAWGICESCWTFDPEQRITMASVVEKLNVLNYTADEETQEAEEVLPGNLVSLEDSLSIHTSHAAYSAGESDPPLVNEEDGQGINADDNINPEERADPKSRTEDLTGSTLVPEVRNQKKMLTDDSDVDNDSPCTQAEAHRPEELVVASVAGESLKAEPDNDVDSRIVPEDHPEMVKGEPTALTIAQAEEPPSVFPETQVPSSPAGAATGNGHEGVTDVPEKEGVPPSNEPPDRPKGPLARFFGRCLKILLCR
ncbi:hypothetical protein M0805_001130 [Coniferiporia weirii]|nr:hypothetical protein M0805_001130 [Coniferiporia weirii]